MRILTAAYEQTHYNALRNRLEANKEKGQKAIVMVPEQFTLQSEWQLLRTLKTQATIDIIVRSFGALGRDILLRQGGIKDLLLDDIGRRMLLKKVLIDHKEQFKMLDNIAQQNGMIDRILQTLVELRSEDVKKEELERLCEGFANQPLSQAKMQETIALWDLYQEKIAQPYLDQEGRIALLADKIYDSANWLKDYHFYFISFHDMSYLELKVLAALDAIGAEVSLFLTYGEQEDPNPAFARSQQFLQRIHHIVANVYEEKLEEQVPYEDLSFLADQVFRNNHIKSYQGDENHITFLRSASLEQEVTYVAAAIRQGVIEEGKRYRDFNIAVTNGEAYLPVIKRVFQTHGIPVFIDSRRIILDNPIMRMVLNAMRMAEEDMPRDAVLAFLHSGMLPLKSENIMAFEGHIKAWYLHGGRLLQDAYFSPDQLTSRRSQARIERESERILKAAEVSKLLQDLFVDLYPLAKEKKPIRVFASAVYYFLIHPILQEGINSFQNICKEAQERDLVEENKQVLDILSDILNQLVETMGDEELEFGDFVAILRSGLEETTIGIIPPAQDQVQVGILNRMRIERTAVQWILGLSDQWMPSKVSNGTVFSDEEKDRMANMNFVMPSYHERLIEEEMLSFYEAILRPTEKLILSYPLADKNGNSMYPAMVIQRALSVFVGKKEVSSLQGMDDLILYSPLYAMSQSMDHLRRLRQGYLGDPQDTKQALAIYNYYQTKDQVEGRFLKAGLSFTNRRYYLDPILAKQLYPALAAGKMSISQIETMRTCPYRHFMAYGIRPQEEERFEVDPRDFGNVLHHALDRLTADIRDQEELLKEDQESLCARMDQYVTEGANEILDQGRLQENRNKAVLNKIRRDARKAGLHITRQLQSSSFQPCAQEIAFGQGEPLAPLALNVNGEVIYLEGRIDRIDQWQGGDGVYLSVIDYKTGNNVFDLTKVMDGLAVQLVLYLKAALGLQEDAKPAGLFYFSLKKPFVDIQSDDPSEIQKKIIDQLLLDGIVIDKDMVCSALDPGDGEGKPLVVKFRKKLENSLSEEQMGQLMAYVQQQCEHTVADIIQGDVRIFPYRYKDAGPCGFCDYSGICRIESDNPIREVDEVSWKALPEMLDVESGEEGDCD